MKEIFIFIYTLIKCHILLLSLVLAITLTLIIIVICIKLKHKRVKSISDLPKNFRNLELKGIATYVNDGDGIRFYHTPKFMRNGTITSKNSLSIRLAGVDAPEMRCFSTPEQPLAKESKAFLKQLVLNKKVRIKVLSIDIFERVVASVFIDSLFCSKNISLEMVKAGLACVYIGRAAEYDDYENKLYEEQKIAKQKKKGIWGLANFVTPMDYKKAKRKC